MRRKALSVMLAVLGLLALGLGASPALASSLYSLKTIIPVPASDDNNVGGVFSSFDISFFDKNTQLDYVADRSNASVDIFSAATNTFVGRVGGSGHLFVGQKASNDISGPDGVLVVNLLGQHQLWAGDGNSTLRAFDVNNNNAELAFSPIATGPPSDKRVDEMAFDPRDKLLMVANNAASPFPFVTLIDTTNGAIKQKITFDGTGGTPQATDGVEQPVWDGHDKVFFLSVPEIGGSAPGGIAVIDALGAGVTKTYNLADFGIASCSPSGLAVGSVKSGHTQLMIGCNKAGSQSILFDPDANGGTGAIVKSFSQVSGEDEVWFDPTTGRFFIAANRNPGGPVLGVIDQDTETFLENISTVTGAHSVAVDPVSGEVFVPFGAGNSICPSGCIAVFVTPEPGSLLLLASALAGLSGVGWRRRRNR